MKTIPSTTPPFLILLTYLALVSLVQAQERGPAVPVLGAEPEIAYKVEASRTVASQGARLTIQRVAPPLLPQATEPVLAPSPDPQLLAARKALFPKRPTETRILSLIVTMVDNGLTRLQWFVPGEDGTWGTFEAWTHQDFRSVRLVGDFDLEDTRYLIWPTVLDGTKQALCNPPVLPVALKNFSPDDPEIFLTKGNASDDRALAPIRALQEIYKKESLQLQAAWEAQERDREERRTWDAAHPATPQDVVFRVWRIEPETAASAKGEARK